MQMIRRLLAAQGDLLMLATPALAQVGGTLTDGAATYIQATAPSGRIARQPGVRRRLRTESTAPNQLFQNWWYYRVAGDTREYPFGSYARSAGGQIVGTSNYTGNTSTYYAGPIPSRFGDAVHRPYTSTLTHGASAGTALLSPSRFRSQTPGRRR